MFDLIQSSKKMNKITRLKFSFLVALQSHTRPVQGQNRVFPVYSFSQGKTCFHYRGTLFSLQGPCFHYREFPVRKCTQGKPCFNYREWVCSVSNVCPNWGLLVYRQATPGSYTANMCSGIAMEVHLKNCNFEKIQFSTVDLGSLYFLLVKNCNFSIIFMYSILHRIECSYYKFSLFFKNTTKKL